MNLSYQSQTRIDKRKFLQMSFLSQISEQMLKPDPFIRISELDDEIL